MRLYEIGPVTGIEDDNRPTFEHEARILRRNGFDVDIPHQLIKSGTSHEEAMRISIRFLTASREGFVEKDGKLVRSRNAPYYDGVAMLPGWENSPGALVEKQVAEACGIPCKTVEEWLRLSRKRKSDTKLTHFTGAMDWYEGPWPSKER